MFFTKKKVDIRLSDYIVFLNGKRAVTLEKVVQMYNDAEFESKHKRDADGKFAKDGGGEHPKKHLTKKPIKGIMKSVEGYKGKPDGTYDLRTGEKKEYTSGYSVTFHQNEPDKDGNFKSIFGRYKPEEYDRLANELAEEYGTDIDVGVFKNPEVSFHIESLQDAAKIAIKFNQHSIYCCKRGKLVKFSGYNPKENPIKGI